METIKIYLSGGMGNLSFEEQSKWRKNIQDAIKFNYDCEKSRFSSTQWTTLISQKCDIKIKEK